MSGEAVREELVRFLQVLVDDADLRAWFVALEQLPDAARHVEFVRIAGEMRAAGEHPDLIHATALLAQPGVYRAMRLTLDDALADA